LTIFDEEANISNSERIGDEEQISNSKRIDHKGQIGTRDRIDSEDEIGPVSEWVTKNRSGTSANR
jgi:UDP-3-O-[3-hydroxymyristoyl] glucosamine N-acyltransferase